MTSSDNVLQFGPFRLLPQSRILLKGGGPVRLGSRAREILFFLVERAGSIVKNHIERRKRHMSRILAHAVLSEYWNIAACRQHLRGGGRAGRGQPRGLDKCRAGLTSARPPGGRCAACGA